MDRTRDELLAEAAWFEARAARISEACAILEENGRDSRAFRASEARARDAAAKLRGLASDLDTLTDGKQRATVSNVTPEARRAISEFRGSDEFLSAVRAKGYASVREMVHDIRRPGEPEPVEKPVVSAAFISSVRAQKRPMPEWLADEIERLTGFEKSKWWRVVSAD